MFYRYFKVILFLSWCIAPIQNNLICQDTILIPTITITDHFFPLSSTYFNNTDTTNNSSAYLSDVGILISKLSPVHLRQYGPGLSYSLSIRGGNSAQVNVLWNDLPVSNPMLGQSDLSLYRLTGSSKLIYDPNTYSYGLSGTLSLKEELPSKEGLGFSISEKISSTLGHDLSSSISFVNKHFATVFQIGLLNNKNHFKYRFNDSIKYIQNNAIDQYYAKLNLEYKISNKQKLRLNAWTQYADREIPASLHEAKSDATQLDRFNRMLLSYQVYTKRGSVKVASAYLEDHLVYDAPLKSLHSNSKIRRFVQQFKVLYKPWNSASMKLEIENQLIRVISNAYFQTEKLNELSLRYQLEQSWVDTHKLQAGIRAGIRDFKAPQIAPYFYYQYHPVKGLSFLISAGRKFRFPAMNDLFWTQGGSESLLAERALETEFGFSYKINKNFSVQNRSYYKKVNNWIQWAPVSGVFEAKNLEEVRSYGLENEIHGSYDQKPIKVGIDLSHQYNRTFYYFGENKYKQLIYTPSHVIKSNISLSWQRFKFLINPMYNSRVYTTPDHFEALNPYFIFNSTLEYSFDVESYEILSWFSVNNMFNEDYFTIKNYVMPGRTFELGISLRNKH